MIETLGIFQLSNANRLFQRILFPSKNKSQDNPISPIIYIRIYFIALFNIHVSIEWAVEKEY